MCSLSHFPTGEGVQGNHCYFIKTLVFNARSTPETRTTLRKKGWSSVKPLSTHWATPSPLGAVYPFSWNYTMKHATIIKYQLHRHLERNQPPRQPTQSTGNVVEVATSSPIQLPFTRQLFWKIFENWVIQSQESELADFQAALSERVANGKFNNLFMLMQLALGQERDARKNCNPLPLSLVDQIELAISKPISALAH